MLVFKKMKLKYNYHTPREKERERFRTVLCFISFFRVQED